ncbi:hypothetical protein BV25DRAFT_1860623 [Artomyces pyxidatus]|uniref:Uncharacterized protein n=1 Tax=Artomyces pyxidatus TaxID=48021 RepID=A0ACB8SSB4_9AGAM|nr:hypothetical protein BV25DRAFT_1860623 [Artomyces pyxidatus]
MSAGDGLNAQERAAAPLYTRQLSDEPSSEQIPFPSAETPPVAQSGSAESKLTDSDKLSELPAPASPSLRPLRNPARAFHRSLDNTGTVSAPDVRPLSSPALLPVSISDVSVGRDASKQRVSFDSDRGSLPNFSPRQITRHTPTSDPVLPTNHGAFSSILRKHHSRTRKESGDSRSRSRSHSRAASPLRHILDRFPLHRSHSREEPFVAVDPWRMQQNPFGAFTRRLSGSRKGEGDSESKSEIEKLPGCFCMPLLHSSKFHAGHVFLFDTFPRQLYLHTLMRLPSLYFSRVARIFEDAEVSRPDIQRMIDACVTVKDDGDHGPVRLPFPEDWNPPHVSPALARFKYSWEAFVDTLVREWKTLNVVSALLLSAILTIFQIPDAAGDPVTRTAALLSLVCALMSLSYGIIFIIRFGTMRSMYRASRWADEARKTRTSMLWNVWVLLALPSIWLAWSMMAFIAAILSFVWRTGATDDPSGDDPNPRALNPRQALGPRLAITCVLALGLFYFAMVVRTFKSYGESSRRKRPFQRRRADPPKAADGNGQATGADTDLERGQPESEDEVQARGRDKERRSVGRSSKGALGLGLTGMDQKVEGNGVKTSIIPADEKTDRPTSSSMSSIGM